jgi:hypothetical protein
MTPAKLRVAALALALGTAGLAAGARADANAAHLPVGSDTCWRPGAEPTAAFEAFTGAGNVSVDPATGVEVYMPTGETVDQVLPVVATRLPLPAVASVGGSGIAAPPAQEACWSCLAYQASLPAGLVLLLTGWVVLRRRRNRGAAGSSLPRIGTGLVL